MIDLERERALKMCEKQKLFLQSHMAYVESAIKGLKEGRKFKVDTVMDAYNFPREVLVSIISGPDLMTVILDGRHVLRD